MERISHLGPARPAAIGTVLPRPAPAAASTRERMVRSGLRVVRAQAAGTFVPRVIPFGRAAPAPGSRIPAALAEE